MSAFKLIHYFSSHPAVLGFQASLPPDIVTLNPANKRIVFQTGTSAAVHATLDTEQLTSCTRTPLVDTIFSPQGSDGRPIAALEVHELLTNIHDILVNAVSKWISNVACILAFLSNFASS